MDNSGKDNTSMGISRLAGAGVGGILFAKRRMRASEVARRKSRVSVTVVPLDVEGTCILLITSMCFVLNNLAALLCLSKTV
jgi:hypothetical protein